MQVENAGTSNPTSQIKRLQPATDSEQPFPALTTGPIKDEFNRQQQQQQQQQVDVHTPKVSRRIRACTECKRHKVRDGTEILPQSSKN